MDAPDRLAPVPRAASPAPATVDGRPAASPAGLSRPGAPVCPLCHGAMWDNRGTKRSAKAPDFKCKDRGCPGRIWPARPQGIADTLEVVDASGRVAVRGFSAPADEPAPPSAPTDRSAAPASRMADADARDRIACDFRTRADLRACYLTATAFVLSQVVPRYTAAGIAVSDRTVAAIVASLFRATCARDALGGLTLATAAEGARRDEAAE